MCRIAGLWDFNSPVSVDILKSMQDSLKHGGPDGFGMYSDSNFGMIHRRLSILDLSDDGSQPMEYENWVISYNGEVYNFEEIKAELVLCGYSFKSQSDTEVILKSFDFWGEKAVSKFRGMFAIALWNKKNKKLILCRDRMGVKPLYWYFRDGIFMFSSEIKAFHCHPKFEKKINKRSIPHFLRKGYIHPNECIYEYVFKLKPGCFLFFDQDTKRPNEVSYWDINKSYNIFNFLDDDIVIDYVEKQLEESFKLRMVSDVEVGVFLSGGIDSSLITAILQKNSSKPLQTFTIGFEDSKFDESKYAKRVSKELGTKHVEYIFSEKDLIENLPEMPEIYDEPFGDASSIPTFLVSKLAAKNVKVVLSGDGGDELFGGYSKYLFISSFYWFLKIPLFIRKFISILSFKVSLKSIEKISQIVKFKSYPQIESKFIKFRNTLTSKNLDDLFLNSSSYLSGSQLNRLLEKDSLLLETETKIKKSSLLNYLGLKDIKSYLPGDILTKVDRASMRVGLEAREPFLDHKLVELSFQIPRKFKIQNGKNKYVLRRILSKYLSMDLIDRPKQGFTVPIEQWINGFLKNDLLKISEDSDFFILFGLKKHTYDAYLKSYYNGEGLINPYFFWFIFCLKKWQEKWER